MKHSCGTAARADKLGIAKNSLWLLLARIGTQGMAALFTILLARRLGSAGFGEYALIAAIIFVGNMLTTFGTDMSIIREIASRDDLSLLPASLSIQLLFSFLFIVVTWFGAPLLPHQSADGILALRVYSFALIPLAFFTVFTSALRGKQLMSAYTWLNLIGSFLQLAIVWFFLRAGERLMTLAFLLLFSQALITLFGALICSISIQGFWRDWVLSVKDVPKLIKVSAPLALLALIAMVYQKSSVILLSIISGPLLTGRFSVAQRTVEATKTAHVAVFTALYPAMAQNKNETFHLSWMLLLLGAGIGAITLSVFATPLTLILFGSEYEASAPALKILAWVLIPYTISTFLTLKFVASHQETPVLRASLVSLAILTGSSIWWIPRAGLSGACGSVLISEFTQAGLLFLQWRARYEFSELSRETQC